MIKCKLENTEKIFKKQITTFICYDIGFGFTDFPIHELVWLAHQPHHQSCAVCADASSKEQLHTNTATCNFRKTRTHQIRHSGICRIYKTMRVYASNKNVW